MANKAGICSIAGCGWSPRINLGLCNGHYQRLRTYGDPLHGGALLGASKLRIRPLRVEGDLAFVPLTQGREAIIDAIDIPLVENNNWCALVDNRTAYAGSTRIEDGRRKRILMHAIILPVGNGLLPDHIDGDGLNNRRSNLRPATYAQNQYNKRAAATSSSGYKGVRHASWARSKNRWRAQIMKDGARIDLGYHATAEDAARAYDDAAFRLFGTYARLNFGVA